MILGVLLYYIGDAEDFLVQFRNVDHFALFLFLLITYPLIWASCMKWKLFITRNSSSAPSVHRMMRFYTISYFANLFLPSTVGGDIARSFSLGRHLQNHQEALVATFLERLSGLLGMSILALLAYCVTYPLLAEFAIPVISLFLVVSAASVLFLSELGHRIISILMTFLGSSAFGKNKLFKQLEKLVDAHFLIKKSGSLFWKSLSWSFLFHLLAVLNTYYAGQVISLDSVELIDLFVVVPLVLLVSMVPITPGGIGIQEGAFVFLLVKVGASPSQALSVALLLRIKLFILAGLGGLFLLFQKSSSH